MAEAVEGDTVAMGLTAGQLMALRELAEGEPATYGRLAAVAGKPTKTLQQYARRNRWAKVDCRKGLMTVEAPKLARLLARDGADDAFSDGLPSVEDSGDAGPGEAGAAEPLDIRLGRLANGLMAEIERIGAGAGRPGRPGRPLDKGRIDAIWAMIRTLEKIEGFARERAGETAATEDVDVADVLRRIDERIEELAWAYATELIERGVGRSELVERGLVAPEPDQGEGAERWLVAGGDGGRGGDRDPA